MHSKRFLAIALGVVSAFFFSLTFVFNEIMAHSQSYWLLTASLRYIWTLPFMIIVMKIPMLHCSFKKVHHEIRSHPGAWWLWSQFCFVLFYVPLCLSSQYLPGWLVSSTWQLTIILGVLTTPLIQKVPVVLNGQTVYQRLKIPIKAIPWLLLILFGVLLTVFDYAHQLNGVPHLALSLLSMLIAATSYPLGNRKLMAVSPDLNGVEKVWGMLICSYPTWLILTGVGIFKAGWPSAATWGNTLIVALSSGVIATVLFFHATSMIAKNMTALAEVEATQSLEVVFSVILSCLFLGHAFPLGLQLVGLIVMIVGIVGIALRT